MPSWQPFRGFVVSWFRGEICFVISTFNQQRILLIAVLAEIAVFSAIAQNFFTAANFFEVMRFSV